MSEELRPCPFCGGTKICTEKGINLNYCDNCSAESNVEHWNNRPIEDALNARIAELEAEIAKLKAEIEQRADHESYLSQEFANTYYEKNARIAELEADKERLNSCESALISMVNQFFYSKAGENIFRHSFMSAEEEAATYLVEHGIACWTDDYKSAIRFIGA